MKWSMEMSLAHLDLTETLEESDNLTECLAFLNILAV